MKDRANGGCPSVDAQQILSAVENQLEDWLKPSLVPVINATGVMLHTNLGRAPLSQAAIQAVGNAAQGYSNLEFDLERGARGSRLVHAEALLHRLTGAEAALVVNNNAAALLLALTALARREEGDYFAQPAGGNWRWFSHPGCDEPVRRKAG